MRSVHIGKQKPAKRLLRPGKSGQANISRARRPSGAQQSTGAPAKRASIPGALPRATEPNGVTTSRATPADALHKRITQSQVVPSARQRYAVRQLLWRRHWLALSVTTGVAVLVVVLVVVGNLQQQASNVGIGQPVPRSVLHSVTDVSP
jgi:hypothetical protein